MKNEYYAVYKQYKILTLDRFMVRDNEIEKGV